MHRRSFLTVAVGVTAALAGCSGGPSRELPSTPTGDWTHRAHDARNSAAADVPVPPRGTAAWDRGEAHVATPLVDGDTVYSVASEATALDARTGEERWEADLPESAEQTPALTDDRLVVAAEDRLLALDRADGEELWALDLPRPADDALTVDPDSGLVTVPLPGRQGVAGIVAYDTENGDRLWADDTLSPRMTAIADGTVYVAGYLQDGDTGVLRALSASDGARQWESELDHPDAAPVLADAGLLIADAGTLAIHDPADGSRQRALGEFGEYVQETPAVAGDTAFVTAYDGDLVAVSIADGEERWRRDVTVASGVSVGRDAVVAGVMQLPDQSLSGVAAYERDDGTPRWGHQIDGFDASPSTAPVLAAGAVYYVSNESRGVMALGDLSPTETE